jgi:hypothetical protein
VRVYIGVRLLGVNDGIDDDDAGAPSGDDRIPCARIMPHLVDE